MCVGIFFIVFLFLFISLFFFRGKPFGILGSEKASVRFTRITIVSQNSVMRTLIIMKIEIEISRNKCKSRSDLRAKRRFIDHS